MNNNLKASSYIILCVVRIIILIHVLSKLF